MRKRPDIREGHRVRSHYRAQWTGIVVVVEARSTMCGGKRYDNEVARVRVTHDHNGLPMRKPFLSQWLDTAYLEVLAEKESGEKQ